MAEMVKTKKSPTMSIYDTDDISCEINLSTKRLEI